MSISSPRTRPQLGDEAASFVRDQITSGALAAGSPVRPEVVAAELGISSTPAREALQALRTEGLLELAPRRGFTVATITGEDIRDIFFVQSMVAGEMAARAAEAATAEQLETLRSINDQLKQAADRGDMTEVESLNHEFHRQINLIAGSPKLAWVLKLVTRYVPRRFYASIAGWSQTTIDDHDGVLDALVSGDAESARTRMSAHVTHAGVQLAEYVASRATSD